jgi:hypothetical protein
MIASRSPGPFLALARSILTGAEPVPAGPGGRHSHRGRRARCATLTAMSTDSRPAAAPASPARARQASPMPLKPSLEGLEDKWSRQWEEAGVVQV